MSSTKDFAVNGRFLLHNETGVQRYAFNVLQALDTILADDMEIPILAPKRAQDPGFRRLPIVKSGHLSGHIWEQIDLPARWSGRLLNLCNTAPVVKTDQIVCIHDTHIYSTPESYSRVFRTVYQCLQPLLARRCARIATVSQAAARQLARYLPIRIDDIVVLPNGHEHALRWKPSRAQIAKKLVEEVILPRNRQFILALGSRARHKNLGLLVKTADALDALGIDVVIAGGSAGIYLSTALQQRSNVHFTGRVSDDDLAYLLQRALCLAFPSLAEGFGLPIIEAMALGCPVIAARCASMPEVCGDAALLASPFDPAEWIAHIRNIKESSQLSSELAGRGFEQVRRFSWSQTARGYLDLLEQPTRQAARCVTSRPAPLRTAVVIATRGRPEIVSATVNHLLATQTAKPDTVIVSCVETADAGALAGKPEVMVVRSRPGLAAQRNAALGRLPAGTEIVAFFDDDFVADKDWLAVAIEAFRDESQVVGLTGSVIADGIKGPGIEFQEALARLRSTPRGNSRCWTEPYSPYGCNMAFRVAAIGETRFDERLVLYGWLEDRDFGAALSKRGGRLVKCADAFGVHMGVKGGRVSGERLGYSQIVNPIYMLRKGTMTGRKVADHIFCNMASNLALSAWPEPFIDRRGRFKGNLIAIADLLRGRVEPERAAAIPIFNVIGQPIE